MAANPPMSLYPLSCLIINLPRKMTYMYMIIKDG